MILRPLVVDRGWVISGAVTLLVATAGCATDASTGSAGDTGDDGGSPAHGHDASSQDSSSGLDSSAGADSGSGADTGSGLDGADDGPTTPPDGGAPGDGGDGGPVTSDCPAGRNLLWSIDFGDPNWETAIQANVLYGQSDTSTVADPDHGNVLKVAYPKGSSSFSYHNSTGAPVGGFEFLAPLPGGSSLTSVLVSYWLKFDSTFQWVKGGKLPGVCGGDCPTGGAPVTGAGFSMRYMWRSGGSGEQYAYVSSASAPPDGSYGRELGLGSWKFTAGTWHHIQEEIILNSGTNTDGISRVWYDKAPTATPDFEETDIQYMDRTANPNVGIDRFRFSTFFGGHDGSWATPVTTYTYFAAIQICQ
jgi:hypothetical protein